MNEFKEIKRLLVANRGEISIRIMRAADELKMTTIAIYSDEDRYSLHRFKSDEAYQIGIAGDAIKPYLNIEEIIKLAKEKKIDAIHPGYGFLSENVQMAKRCEEEGILWVGPSSSAMKSLGDKVSGKELARKVNVPIIEDAEVNADDLTECIENAKRIGFPVIIKAAAGGGGRGMRVVRTEEELNKAVQEASNEAKNAFGDATLFIEKFIEDPKHIEVQLLGDKHGNLVHLFERDCSVQRRFQKVVEVAPSVGLKTETKQKLYEYALKIGKAVNYYSAGTVEFLLDKNENVYFIEVNPRIQVEHTVTEEITGIDIVRSQLLIAQGRKLSDSGIRIANQSDLKCNCFAIQCRITTEDPSNNFRPDFGTIVAYRNAGGYGIRLDEGSSYTGKRISPYFDSLLVKVTARGRSLASASKRLDRALKEFRIRGVKTNIPFLLKVIEHETFRTGKATVSFIGNHPELMVFTQPGDKSTKTLKYLGTLIVNGHPEIGRFFPPKFRKPIVPTYSKESECAGRLRKLLSENQGAKKVAQWLKAQKKIQYTDTTFRDAHQSLLATRVRTIDMLAVAEGFGKNHPEIFSMEVWGGATFDVAMRFLYECPWERLAVLREAIPNTLFQMLIRGSNAVGYSSYPKNLIEEFISKSWNNGKGIDIFRIFDSLNGIDSIKFAIKSVLERTGGIAEGAICYTGDVLVNSKYNTKYYVDLAKRIEDEGSHILAIKDMAGLLKPLAAEHLIKELKKSIDIPIHLHTHDTSSIQSATYLKAIDAGVDAIDVALGGLSGLTSQPNFNSIVAMLKGHERELPMNLKSLNAYSNYWEDVREYYFPFESGLKSGTAEVYEHEIPGGQYSNLKPQARSLGLIDKFEDLKKNYAVVNRLFGDIVKVTPSSKVVGDMALFMLSNDLTEENIYEKGKNLSFPSSVKDFFKGDLGVPYGGFPEKIQTLILKGEKIETYTSNFNTVLDIKKDKLTFKEKFPHIKDEKFDSDYLSYKMYPKVYEDFYNSKSEFGDLTKIETPYFYYALKEGQEILISIDKGKEILVKYLYAMKPNDFGKVVVFFELNGQTRHVEVKSNEAEVRIIKNPKVSNENEIGSPLQGKISRIIAKEGDKVTKGSPLFVIEAMKMESIVESSKEAIVSKITLNAGATVEQDDCVIILK